MKGIKIENYSNYWIFPELGMIWSIPRIDRNNHFVKGGWIGTKQPNGYWKVAMYADDGTKMYTSLQRVIWMSVNGEIPEGYEINHLSEKKDENFISNLSLTSKLENIRYGTGIQRRAEKQKNNKFNCKQVGKYSLDGVLIETFPSIAEAGRQGYRRTNISQCINGSKLTHKGFIWRYVA